MMLHRLCYFRLQLSHCLTLLQIVFLLLLLLLLLFCACLPSAVNCTIYQYLDAHAVIPYDQSCLVIYSRDLQLTWFDAVSHCMKRGAAGLAVINSRRSAQVDVIDASLIPNECCWVGLVKPFFQWTASTNGKPVL